LLTVLAINCVVISAWWSIALILSSVIARHFMLQLLDIIARTLSQQDLIIDRNGLGFLIGRQRFWVFLDGIVAVESYVPDMWTVRHCNGRVFHIPASELTGVQVEYLRPGADRGRLWFDAYGACPED